VDENKTEAHALIFAGFQQVAKLAFDSNKLREAGQALEQQAKMLGLYAPSKVELSGDLYSLNEEQLSEQLDHLKKAQQK
jgi:hypothetical protein